MRKRIKRFTVLFQKWGSVMAKSLTYHLVRATLTKIYNRTMSEACKNVACEVYEKVACEAYGKVACEAIII